MNDNNKQEQPCCDSEYMQIADKHKNGIPPISFEEFQKKHVIDLRLLAISTLLSIIALDIGLFLNFSGEANNIWFQRSGSLIILFSVISEYLLYTVANDRKTILIKHEDKEISTIFDKELKDIYPNTPVHYDITSFLFKPIINSLIIVGTFIWGYGDLFYNEFIILTKIMFILPFIILILYLIKRYYISHFK